MVRNLLDETILVPEVFHFFPLFSLRLKLKRGQRKPFDFKTKVELIFMEMDS